MPERHLPTFVFAVAAVFSALFAILTPPLQVPDEMQHFARAYQIAEGHIATFATSGTAGAILPSALPEMTEHFLGTRMLHTSRPIPTAGLRAIWAYRGVKLEPQRREFVPFSLTVMYPPSAYLPQAAGIAVAKALGAGPLWLLTAGRLANGFAAALLLALAVRITPIGKLAFAVSGLLPMALFEFGSTAVDAPLISSAFLFAAITLEARQVGWSNQRFAIALACALIFFVAKPVYAPLLLMAVPPRMDGTRGWRFQAILLVVALVCGAAWFRYAGPSFTVPRLGANVPAQRDFVLHHPLAYLSVLARTVEVWWQFYWQSLVGILGWLNVPLPGFVYTLAAVGLLLSVVGMPPTGRRQPLWLSAWDLALAAGAFALIITSLYVYWTPPHQAFAEGVQGRYLFPMLPMICAALVSLSPLPINAVWRQRVGVAVCGIILVDAAVTLWTVLQAYGTI